MTAGLWLRINSIAMDFHRWVYVMKKIYVFIPILALLGAFATGQNTEASQTSDPGAPGQPPTNPSPYPSGQDKTSSQSNNPHHKQKKSKVKPRSATPNGTEAQSKDTIGDPSADGAGIAAKGNRQSSPTSNPPQQETTPSNPPQ